MKKKIKVKGKLSNKKKSNDIEQISPKNVLICFIGLTIIFGLIGLMFWQIDKTITLKNKAQEEANSVIALKLVDDLTNYSLDELVYDGMTEDGRYNVLVIESAGTSVEKMYSVDIEKKNFKYIETFR